MKKIILYAIFILLLHNNSARAQAQSTKINGKVTSFEESLPLEGVSVFVKGSANSTGTQADGTFSLSVGPNEKVLLLSLQGYEKKEIPVTIAKSYDIVLKRANSISYGIPPRALSRSGTGPQQ